MPVQGKTPLRIQPKLTIGKPEDALEQEADRVAEQVMRLPEPPARSHVPAGRSDHPAASAKQVQTKSSHAGDSGGMAAPPIVHDVLRSPGRPLDTATRAFMEPRFGHDFGKVRVHADARAAEAASSINARAFTSNRSVVFGANQYAPQTESGRRLVAHELTHVVQQRAPTVQRKEAAEVREAPELEPEPGLDPPAEDQGKECGFRLIVEGVTYCFSARENPSTPGSYGLDAWALQADDHSDEKAKNKKKEDTKQILYSARIGVTVENNKRVISPAGEIVMTGFGAKSRQYEIHVDSLALAAAWDVYARPVQWDFVVLEVYDGGGKELPLRVIIWMGGPWGEKTPDKPGTKVATFRVDRKEVESQRRNYFVLRKEFQNELLRPEQVSAIIKGKEPKVSDKGFDKNTYVGMDVKGSLSEIDDPKSPGGVAKVPFDEAAGRYRGKSQFVSHLIVDPPKEIVANFSTGASAVPGGLSATSLAQFSNQVRSVLLFLQDTSGVDIEIHAYTDTVGTAETNGALSQARADSAKKYMTDATVWTGVDGTPAALDPQRIVLSKGEGQALAEEAFKQNHPEDWKKYENKPALWKKLIGNETQANEAFRKFEIKYIVRKQ
jgi:flagellar motor protein MotB